VAHSFRRVLSALAIVIVMTFSTTLASSSPASAQTVRGCAQSWSEWVGTCVTVVTGSKNAGNRTQWVSSVTVNAPREARVVNRPGRLEAWAGNGPTGVAWYRSANGLSITWSVNMWIKNGSGICGAFPSGGSRSIACITIRV
jgi:hypothetical protein